MDGEEAMIIGQITNRGKLECDLPAWPTLAFSYSEFGRRQVVAVPAHRRT
jgi:hypothetical protein